MTDPTPPMIASGVPYDVIDVEGHTPASLDEFSGSVTMHTHGPTGDHEVSGACEHEHDGAVRLHEKDHHGTGRDVRVWTVTPGADGEGFGASG
ncbi:hypothetical protein [Actinotalea sp. C106]|uniref:hypothetical protein n=1 Tax=Actinotalea sp. C106 TaxID=2908644 RepID=UPI0020280108|nr:hypothetical protein [Actinotalea sp. C106]